MITKIGITKIGISLMCLALASIAIAEEDVYDGACDFVKAHSTPEAEAQWLRAWKKKAEQMQADNPQMSSESKAADEVLLRYLRERRKKLGDVQKGEQPEKLTPAEKLEICRFYILFKDNVWDIDHDLADFITKENFKRYVAGEEIVQPDDKK